MAAFSFPNPRNRAVRTFIVRLSRSRFFTISVALHFVFVLSFGGVVLVRNAATPTDVMDSTGELVQSASVPPAPDAVQPSSNPSRTPRRPRPSITSPRRRSPP